MTDIETHIRVVTNNNMETLLAKNESLSEKCERLEEQLSYVSTRMDPPPRYSLGEVGRQRGIRREAYAAEGEGLFTNRQKLSLSPPRE